MSPIFFFFGRLSFYSCPGESSKCCLFPHFQPHWQWSPDQIVRVNLIMRYRNSNENQLKKKRGTYPKICSNWHTGEAGGIIEEKVCEREKGQFLILVSSHLPNWRHANGHKQCTKVNSYGVKADLFCQIKWPCIWKKKMVSVNQTFYFFKFPPKNDCLIHVADFWMCIV